VQRDNLLHPYDGAMKPLFPLVSNPIF